MSTEFDRIYMLRPNLKLGRCNHLSNISRLNNRNNLYLGRVGNFLQNLDQSYCVCPGSLFVCFEVNKNHIPKTLSSLFLSKPIIVSFKPSSFTTKVNGTPRNPPEIPAISSRAASS